MERDSEETDFGIWKMCLNKQEDKVMERHYKEGWML